MFGIFGKNKKAGGKKSSTPAKTSPVPHPHSQQRDEIIKQAMSNVRSARESIGEEALDKIAESIRKKESSKLEQAKEKIKSMDQEKVADNIKAMLYEDDN